MQGKTVIVTGATSGIGFAAAEALVRRGARLILVGRDQQRGAAALERLRAVIPSAEVSIRYADLLRLSEVRRLAEELAELPRIDVLVNNAGAFFDRHALTEDGIERTFALNHMAYFLLTYLLLDRLKASAPARIVNVASGAHRRGSLDFGDLEGRRSGAGWPAYCRSKLANVLFTTELARRLAGSGVTANALHPGFVASRFGDETGLRTRLLLGFAKRIAAISPERGAETILYLAAAPKLEGISGDYFEDCREAQPSAAARDMIAARRLWEESERLAGVGPSADAGKAGRGSRAAI
jgi:NAD(P)-dependent dehydrogenase (short-subunit alcohol dehydrogenase family)